MTANSPDSKKSPSDAAQTSIAEASSAQTIIGKRVRNFIIVLVAIVLTASVFLGLKTETGTGLLSAMAEESVPLEIALSNGKPTLMEFYANWCTSCQAMAPDMAALEQEYGDRVNFVMLNVDNSKWLPEVLSYRVDGIPHFVFLGQDGNAIAQSIGEQPRSIMEANLVALAGGDSLPYAKTSGQTSAFSAPVTTKANADSDPRSHSSQVVAP
ncbi:thioredoxin family protein [Leptolyngbya sp. FACHB-321]|uniref:thioredoxin family protein n=1 Tax=Leptolyngbya sp. FACHB-321 TaxID=2692807 RepID=UPI001689967A|nr:thioredoxin family protein [Leptolyngbya sp. FACHB-321]MBD2037231.1 thioredoxin family protein [Leptolyngbya sp. FACHB-321]